MKARKQLSFYFVDTEEEAIRSVAGENASMSSHYKKHHPAHYTSWTSPDRTESKFIVWTYE